MRTIDGGTGAPDHKTRFEVQEVSRGCRQVGFRALVRLRYVNFQHRAGSSVSPTRFQIRMQESNQLFLDLASQAETGTPYITARRVIRIVYGLPSTIEGDWAGHGPLVGMYLSIGRFIQGLAYHQEEYLYSITSHKAKIVFKASWYEKLDTPSEGLMCAFHAVGISIQHMYPSMILPTPDQLDAIFTSRNFQRHMHSGFLAEGETEF